MSKFHELLLSELRMVVYQPGDAELTDRMLCEAVTLNENLCSLGFTLRPGDQILLAKSPELYCFYDKLHVLVPQVNARPMYPGFPQQVLDMDEAEFRLHQAMHYFSTYGLEQLFDVKVSRGWLPEDHTPERTKEASPLLEAIVIELVPDVDAPKTVLRILLGRRERLTNPELSLVTKAVTLCDVGDLDGLTVRFKENLELLFPRLLVMIDGNAAVRILHAVCAHSGDVLRCAHAFLKEHSYHLKTVEKKRLVRLLEQYSVSNLKDNLIQSRHLRERNLLVMRYLDFNRFSKSEAHRETVRALRNDELLSWNGIAEQMLARHDPKALHFLAGRPGAMVRMINRLLSLDYSIEEILTELKPHTGQFSGQMLTKAIRSLAGSAGKLEELHQKEILDCMQRYDEESRSVQWAKWRYDWELCRIRDDAEERRRNARETFLVNPKRQVKKQAQAMVQEVETATAEKQAELAACCEHLKRIEKIQESFAKGRPCGMIRSATSGFDADLPMILFQPESLLYQVSHQQEVLLHELKELKARLALKQQEVSQWLDTVLKDISANNQTACEAAIREIDVEEQQQLDAKKAEMDAELAPMLVKEALWEERRTKELAILDSLHQSRLRISKDDAAAASVLKELCTEHFRRVETPLKGKKVFLQMDEFDLEHSEVETTDRSRDGGYIRSGIAFRIPEEAKTVRFFVYWNDQDRVDVDLHAAGTTLAGRELHIGWNADFKNSGVVYSGDITHSDAAEYVDIDLSGPIRNITANICLFSGKPSFRDVETCFVGMMAVSELGEEVRLYSPANCFFTHHLTQKTRDLFYGYIDVRNRFVRFIGQPNSSSWDEQCTADTSFSLAEYLGSVLEGQGAQRVSSREEADVVVTMGKSKEENGISLVDENFFMEC